MSIAKLINEGIEYPLKRIDNDVFSVFGDYELKKKTFMENNEEIEDTIEFEPERDRELTKDEIRDMKRKRNCIYNTYLFF